MWAKFIWPPLMFMTMFICSMRPICLYIIHQKEDLIGCCWSLTDGQTTLKNRASLSWEVGVEDSKHKDFPQDRAHKEANQPTNVRRGVRLSLHMRPTVLAKTWRLVGCSKLPFWLLKLSAGTMAIRICMTCYGKVDRLAGKTYFVQKIPKKSVKNRTFL